MLIGYFFYLIYLNRSRTDFIKENTKLFVWGIAFLIVFILSTELILQGLHIGNVQLSSEQLTELSSDQGRNGVRNLMVNSNMRIAKFKIIKTALPILWGILAFIFLLVGVKKQVKELRVIALSLLGITILKLFTYDISNVSETGKIIFYR